jgi:hypothetical protein
MLKTFKTKTVDITCVEFLRPDEDVFEMSVELLNTLIDWFPAIPAKHIVVDVCFSMKHYIELNNGLFGLKCEISEYVKIINLNTYRLIFKDVKSLCSDVEKVFLGYECRYKHHDFFVLEDFQSSRS